MGPRRALGTLLVLVASSVGLTVLPGAVPAAHAVTGGPPVTSPDSGTLYAGGIAVVQPINNDHDPDNDLLTICRLGTEHHRGMEVGFFQNDWQISARPNVKPGTYTFTYYACDYSYLVPGTITITVKPQPEITVQRLSSRPGHLRVTNGADVKILFLYGSFDEDKPDGRLRVGKGDSVIFAVHRKAIDWIATDRDGVLFYVSGRVTGIRLGRSAAPGRLSHVTLGPRLAGAWRAA